MTICLSDRHDKLVYQKLSEMRCKATVSAERIHHLRVRPSQSVYASRFSEGYARLLEKFALQILGFAICTLPSSRVPRSQSVILTQPPRICITCMRSRSSVFQCKKEGGGRSGVGRGRSPSFIFKLPCIDAEG